MLLFLSSLLLISNALILRKDKSILFSRIVMVSLVLTSFLTLNNLFTLCLGIGIGIYGGQFHVTAFTQIFKILDLGIGIFGGLFLITPFTAIFNNLDLVFRILAVYYLNVIKNIFFFKYEYRVNPTLASLNLHGVIQNNHSKLCPVPPSRQDKIINFKLEDIVLSSALSNVVSILTLIIILYIFIPNEWFSIANILTPIVLKT